MRGDIQDAHAIAEAESTAQSRAAPQVRDLKNHDGLTSLTWSN